MRGVVDNCLSADHDRDTLFESATWRASDGPIRTFTQIEKALRVMTLEDERRLVQKVMDENVMIGGYVGLLSEAGLRKSEGLKLIEDDK